MVKARSALENYQWDKHKDGISGIPVKANDFFN